MTYTLFEVQGRLVWYAWAVEVPVFFKIKKYAKMILRSSNRCVELSKCDYCKPDIVAETAGEIIEYVNEVHGYEIPKLWAVRVGIGGKSYEEVKAEVCSC